MAHTFIPIAEVRPGMVIIPSFGGRRRRVVKVSRSINENGIDEVTVYLARYSLFCDGYVTMAADRQVAKVIPPSEMRKAAKASAA